MASRLFARLIRLPSRYFEQRQVGDITAKFESVDALRMLLSNGLVDVALDGITVLLALIALAALSPLCALVCTSALAVYFIVRSSALSNQKQLADECVTAKASVDTAIIETVKGMSTVKAMRLEQRREVAWTLSNRALENAVLRATRSNSVMEISRGGILALELSALLYVLAFDQSIVNQPGVVVAVLAYGTSEQVPRIVV